MMSDGEYSDQSSVNSIKMDSGEETQSTTGNESLFENENDSDEDSDEGESDEDLGGGKERKIIASSSQSERRKFYEVARKSRRVFLLQTMKEYRLFERKMIFACLQSGEFKHFENREKFKTVCRIFVRGEREVELFISDLTENLVQELLDDGGDGITKFLNSTKYRNFVIMSFSLNKPKLVERVLKPFRRIRHKKFLKSITDEGLDCYLKMMFFHKARLRISDQKKFIGEMREKSRHIVYYSRGSKPGKYISDVISPSILRNGKVIKRAIVRCEETVPDLENESPSKTQKRRRNMTRRRFVHHGGIQFDSEQNSSDDVENEDESIQRKKKPKVKVKSRANFFSTVMTYSNDDRGVDDEGRERKRKRSFGSRGDEKIKLHFSAASPSSGGLSGFVSRRMKKKEEKDEEEYKSDRFINTLVVEDKIIRHNRRRTRSASERRREKIRVRSYEKLLELERMKEEEEKKKKKSFGEGGIKTPLRMKEKNGKKKNVSTYSTTSQKKKTPRKRNRSSTTSFSTISKGILFDSPQVYRTDRKMNKKKKKKKNMKMNMKKKKTPKLVRGQIELTKKEEEELRATYSKYFIPGYMKSALSLKELNPSSSMNKPRFSSSSRARGARTPSQRLRRKNEELEDFKRKIEERLIVKTRELQEMEDKLLRKKKKILKEKKLLDKERYLDKNRTKLLHDQLKLLGEKEEEMVTKERFLSKQLEEEDLREFKQRERIRKTFEKERIKFEKEQEERVMVLERESKLLEKKEVKVDELHKNLDEKSTEIKQKERELENMADKLKTEETEIAEKKILKKIWDERKDLMKLREESLEVRKAKSKIDKEKKRNVKIIKEKEKIIKRAEKLEKIIEKREQSLARRESELQKGEKERIAHEQAFMKKEGELVELRSKFMKEKIVFKKAKSELEEEKKKLSNTQKKLIDEKAEVAKIKLVVDMSKKSHHKAKDAWASLRASQEKKMKMNEKQLEEEKKTMEEKMKDVEEKKRKVEEEIKKREDEESKRASIESRKMEIISKERLSLEYEECNVKKKLKKRTTFISRENKSLIRDRQFMPLDKTLVTLPSERYINSTELVLFADKKKKKKKNKKDYFPGIKYLVTQWPIRTAEIDAEGEMWEMVYDRKCHVIIVLERPVERVKDFENINNNNEEEEKKKKKKNLGYKNKKDKEDGYPIQYFWPKVRGVEEKVGIKSNTWKVKTVVKEGLVAFDHFVVEIRKRRKKFLGIAKGKRKPEESHGCHILIYRDFDEHGVPKDGESYLDLIHEARKLMEEEEVVVVSRFGVGRAGMFVVSHSIISRFLDGKEEINYKCIPKILKEIRKKRHPMMIRNLDQYTFCFRLIYDVTNKDDVEEEKDGIVLKIPDKKKKEEEEEEEEVEGEEGEEEETKKKKTKKKSGSGIEKMVLLEVDKLILRKNRRRSSGKKMVKRKPSTPIHNLKRYGKK